MKEDVHVRGVSKAIHYREFFFLQKRMQIPCKVSIAAATICHSPKVTVDEGR